MAAIASGTHAWNVVASHRSSHGVQQQRPQQNSSNLLSASSSLFRQVVFSGASATRLGFFDRSRSRSQFLYVLKPPQAFWLSSFSTQVVASTEVLDGVDVDSPPIELSGSESIDSSSLSSELEGAGSRLGEEGPPALEYSSDFLVTEDVPGESPAFENVPGLLNGNDTPSSPTLPASDLDYGQDGTPDLDALQSVKDTVKSVSGSIESTLDSVTSAVKDTVDTATHGVSDTLDSVKSSVNDVFDSVNESISTLVDSVNGTYEKSFDKLKSGVDVDFSSVFRVGTPSNNALKEIVTVVKTAIGSALTTTGSFIAQTYSNSKEYVPADVQSVLTTAEGKALEVTILVRSVIDQTFVVITNAEKAVGIDPDNSAISVIFVVGGSLFLGFVYYNTRYGGYAGDVRPAAALDSLKKEKNVVLVDIRPQELRETEGIPDLRRLTRAKFATVEILKVEGLVRGLLRNASEIETALTAAIIGNLKNVNRDSKVIVVDNDGGGQSKQIARILRKSGIRRAYRLDGGFKAWAASGLRFKPERSLNPLAVLQEDAEDLVEDIKPTPFGVIVVLAGCVAGTYAIVEWQKTFQLIGLIGLAATVYNRVQSYESVDDALADFKLIQRPFVTLTQAIVWIAGLLEPKKLQLATSPSSSAVQGRVIQAAAKHGPIPSGLELVQDKSPEASNDEEDVGGDDNTQSQHMSVEEPLSNAQDRQ